MVLSADAVRDGFIGLSAAVVSDALDRYGLQGQADGLRALGNGSITVGRAYTVRYVPVGATRGSVGDYIDDVAAGQVVVLDNSGRIDCTVWGGILSEVAVGRGIAGTVIHGVCRDVIAAKRLGYPLYSRGQFMRTGKDRVEVVSINEVVSLGTVQVQPGDLLVADLDGVVVVPQAVEDKILAAAREIKEAEDRILDRALSGETLANARAAGGYHRLQRGVRDQ
jgi:regulator of RNase E activity RraA